MAEIAGERERLERRNMSRGFPQAWRSTADARRYAPTRVQELNIVPTAPLVLVDLSSASTKLDKYHYPCMQGFIKSRPILKIKSWLRNNTLRIASGQKVALFHRQFNMQDFCRKAGELLQLI
jgi:hypothetical protein